MAPFAIELQDGTLEFPTDEEILEAGSIPPNPDQPPDTTPPEEVPVLDLEVKDETIRQQEAGSALEAGLPVDERTNAEKEKDNMTAELPVGEPSAPPLALDDPQANGMKTLRNMTPEIGVGAPSPEEPVPVDPPTVVDVPALIQNGAMLNCTMGNWNGEPTAYAYQWQLDGVDAGTGTADLDVSANVGQTATCTVTATNAAGSGTSTSDPLVIV